MQALRLTLAAAADRNLNLNSDSLWRKEPPLSSRLPPLLPLCLQDVVGPRWSTFWYVCLPVRSCSPSGSAGFMVSCKVWCAILFKSVSACSDQRTSLQTLLIWLMQPEFKIGYDFKTLLEAGYSSSHFYVGDTKYVCSCVGFGLYEAR